MRKISLPIAENPEMISYTHNAFISSILGSEWVGGELAAKYEIISDHTQFEKYEEGCETTMDEEVIVKAPIMNEHGYSLVFDKCNEKESFIVKVNARRKISSREHICIVLDEVHTSDEFNPEQCMTRFGCPSGLRIIVKRRERYLEEKKSKRILSRGYYLRLEKNELKVTYSYSEDGKHWEIVREEKLAKRYEIVPLVIGVIVETKNDYMNWKASNYLQMYMKSPSEGDIMIDYYLGPTKHYKTFFSNHFFDFIYDYLDYKKLSCKKMTEYIYHKLQETFYMIISIDHYYVPLSANYHAVNHFHEVMIYGIDFLKRVYQIMAYGDKGNVIITEVGFKEFWKSLDSNQIMFVLGRLNPNYNRYEINKAIIGKRIREYLDGINSENDIADIVPGQTVMNYGIDILCHLVHHEDDLYIFCNDNRLSYALYEHKKLMLQRMEYLEANGILGDSMTEDIWKDLRRNLQLTEIIKNNILMNVVGNNKKSSMEKIRCYLMEVVENEKRCYEKIYQILQE